MACEQSNLKLAIDWIYVFYLPLTLILGVVVSIWLQRMDRRKDRKEAKQKSEEERKKADTEKILALLSLNYDEAAEKYQDLKVHLNDLKRKEIVTASGTFTELHVLVYICHRDKFKRAQFTPTPQAFAQEVFAPHAAFNQSSDGTTYGSKEVMTDVNKIMKFFINFGVQLSGIEKDCPGSMRDEFSTDIIEMGETIYPFITKTRKKLIDQVSAYFKPNTEPNTEPNPEPNPEPSTAPQENHHSSPRCWRPCCSYVHCSPPSRSSGTVQSEAVPLTENGEHLQSTTQGAREVMPYPSSETSDTIRAAIPYIQHFEYKSGKMDFHLKCGVHSIDTLALKYGTGEITLKRRQKEMISNEIRCHWPDLTGDLLHLLRMVMFRLKDDPDTDASALNKLVQSIVNPTWQTVAARRYESIRDDMAWLVNNPTENLEHAKTGFENLRGQLDDFLAKF